VCKIAASAAQLQGRVRKF